MAETERGRNGERENRPIAQSPRRRVAEWDRGRFHDKLQKANTGWKIEDEERGNSTILFIENLVA